MSILLDLDFHWTGSNPLKIKTVLVWFELTFCFRKLVFFYFQSYHSSPKAALIDRFHITFCHENHSRQFCYQRSFSHTRFFFLQNFHRKLIDKYYSLSSWLWNYHYRRNNQIPSITLQFVLEFKVKLSQRRRDFPSKSSLLYEYLLFDMVCCKFLLLFRQKKLFVLCYMENEWC